MQRSLKSISLSYLFSGIIASSALATSLPPTYDDSETVTAQNNSRQLELTISADRNFSAKTGADLSHSLLELYSFVDDKYFAGDSVVNKLLRGAVGFQVALYVTTFNHEVLGHGARLREFRVPAHYRLWLSGSGVAYPSKSKYPPLHPREKIAFTTGGMEASDILGSKYRNNFLTNGGTTPVHSAGYLLSNHDQTHYVLMTKWDKATGHDAQSYISEVNTTYGKQVVTKNKLQSYSLLNLLDPMSYFALKSFFTQEDVTVEMLNFQAFSYLPGLRAVLAPYGVEVKFANHFKVDNILAELNFITGSSSTNKSFTVEAKVNQLYNLDKIDFGVNLALWKQPELLGKDVLVNNDALTYGAVPSQEIKSKAKTGYLIAANANYHINNSYSFMVEGGYKTKGYISGETLKRGAYVRAGLTYRF